MHTHTLIKQLCTTPKISCPKQEGNESYLLGMQKLCVIILGHVYAPCSCHGRVKDNAPPLTEFVLFQPACCTDSASICEGGDLCMGNCDLRHACLLQRVNNHHHSFIFPTPSVHPPLHLCQMWHYVFSLMIFQLYCFSKEMTAGKPPCTWSSTELWGLWQRKGCLGKRPREIWLSCSLCKSSISRAAT